MPGVPGVPRVPAPGPAGMPDSPVPGAISIPSPQPGLPSGKPDGAPSTAQSGKGESPAGAGQDKTDDEILAEALAELNKRNKPIQEGGEQQGGEDENAGGQLTQAGAGGPAATGAERKQALGKQLEDEFAKFDRTMLGEQETMTKEANREGYGGLPDGDDLLADDGTAEGAAQEPLQTAMVDSDPMSIKGEGNKATRDHSRVPPDLVSAAGDDIIARQLREAAMKEEDPELRAKLWDEYRKYKRDLR